MYKAYEELKVLGVIRSEDFDSKTLDLDVDCLFNLGFHLVFDINKRANVFVKNKNLQSVNKTRPYVNSPTVPISSLKSYTGIKI